MRRRRPRVFHVARRSVGASVTDRPAMDTRMPAVFIGHGSPMNTLERNRYTDAWRAFGAAVPRPRAIVVVSAHW